MDNLKKAVFLAGFGLFIIWFWPNIQMLTGDRDGTIRLVLAGFFALVILLRLKPRKSRALGGVPGIIAAGVLGAALAVTGLMFTIHQFEWLGIILVLYACLRWSLPDRWSEDIVRALFVLYWIHPLPGRLFGWFEVLMQKLSIMGGEWLLHIFNIRVWADGVFIRTGHHVFGVPEACSGMRAAVTMLICVLGVSILFKQKWWETIVFMVLGSLQVLVLNIVRITFMISWADRMPKAWSETFLHDSLGLFLLTAIFLVQAEMSWWKVRTLKARKLREQIEKDEVEGPDLANTLPRIWYLILLSLKWVLPILLISLACAFAGYKRRPFHRAAMISDVVTGLMETDPASAEAAVNAALDYMPGSRELLDKKAHVLILREKYSEVLETVNRIAPPLDTFETVMKSWALMSLKRPEEALSLVAALPPSEQEIPGVAIVKAEYAVILDDLADVSSNVLVAAGSAFTTSRIRGIYPYLASREQWPVIAESNNFDVPFDDIVSALIVMQAYIRQGDLANASRVLEAALQSWPDDPQLLRALYFMALHEPGQRWEKRFAKNFIANIKSFSADETSKRMNMAFRLGRPDLGWLAYRRLQELDPSDPDLFLAPARHGAKWFLVKRRQIGVPRKDGRETIDLGPFVSLTGDSPFLRHYWKQIPLAEEMSSRDREIFRAKMLKRAVAEFEERLESGRASERIESAYPIALGIAGRFDDAHSYLDGIAERYPERAVDITFQHADFYHAENRWEECYEELRRYFSVKDNVGLSPYLMLVDSLMSMNLGVYALDVLKEARARFPGARELALAEASLWNVFGFRDMALHLLGDDRESQTAYLRMKLLAETGRYREAEAAANALGLRLRETAPVSQKISLPPAELTVENRWPEPLGEDELRERFTALSRLRTELKSPLLMRMAELEAAFLRDGEASVESWSEAGRNRREKASALHRLTVLAGRQEKRDLAEAAAREAARLLPKSPVLWRMLIAVSEGDRNIIAEARELCPDDPEIWLASLVTAEYSKDDDATVSLEIAEVLAEGAFPPETYIRAGDFLIRKRQFRAAFALAAAAESEAQGLLSANMLALRCALLRRDLDGALASALRGVENALDPAPFYEMIVALKSAGRMADGNLVEALEQLRAAYPEKKKWTEDLGMVYFERGDTVRALSILNTLIKKDVRNVTARSFMLAAESARIEGELERAVDILKSARALYPEKDMILNNLVYTMAQDGDTLDEATALLPELERVPNKTFHIHDTIATVHMQNGRLEEARKHMEKALELIDTAEYSANDVKLNSAELLIKLGEHRAARARIEEVRSDKDRSAEVDRRALRLLKLIRPGR